MRNPTLAQSRGVCCCPEHMRFSLKQATRDFLKFRLCATGLPSSAAQPPPIKGPLRSKMGFNGTVVLSLKPGTRSRDGCYQARRGRGERRTCPSQQR